MTTVKTPITGNGNYINYLETSIFMLSFSIKAFITNLGKISTSLGLLEGLRRLVKLFTNDCSYV